MQLNLEQLMQFLQGQDPDTEKEARRAQYLALKAEFEGEGT